METIGGLASSIQKEIPGKLFEATETKQIPLLQHRQLREGGCIEIDEDVTVEIHFGRSRGKIGQNVQYPSKCSTKGIFGRTRRTKDIFQDSETDLWCS